MADNTGATKGFAPVIKASPAAVIIRLVARGKAILGSAAKPNLACEALCSMPSVVAIPPGPKTSCMPSPILAKAAPDPGCSPRCCGSYIWPVGSGI